MSKQDKWEDIVRSKLENYETDVYPEDWNAILDQLPKQRVINLIRWRYAAAVAALLLMSVSYFLFKPDVEKPVVADVQEVITDPLKRKDIALVEEKKIEPSPLDRIENVLGDNNIGSGKMARADQNAGLKTDELKIPESERYFVAEELGTQRAILNIESQINKTYSELEDIGYDTGKSLLAEAVSGHAKKTPKKRWGFGLGGGSYSIGTDGLSIPDFTSPSNLLSYEAGIFKESANSQRKQDISHKKPISFGVGVGYALNDRWSLQSGLYYSMLRSEWWYVDEYQGVSKQKLHFFGVPLSISYRILEWKKFNLYASAGGMTEWNFNGRIKTNFYTDNKRESSVAYKKESIRMKEWQWSVNGKVGVSYPLIRFMNAFVEGGANYYFDNGSSIETIRSEKPFHLSLQAGIRLGF